MIADDLLQFIWLVVGPNPSEKIRVNWDDDIPNTWKKKMFQTTNQMIYFNSPPDGVNMEVSTGGTPLTDPFQSDSIPN